MASRSVTPAYGHRGRCPRGRQLFPPPVQPGPGGLHLLPVASSPEWPENAALGGHLLGMLTRASKGAVAVRMDRCALPPPPTTTLGNCKETSSPTHYDLHVCEPHRQPAVPMSAQHPETFQNQHAKKWDLQPRGHGPGPRWERRCGCWPGCCCILAARAPLDDQSRGTHPCWICPAVARLEQKDHRAPGAPGHTVPATRRGQEGREAAPPQQQRRSSHTQPPLILTDRIHLLTHLLTHALTHSHSHTLPYTHTRLLSHTSHVLPGPHRPSSCLGWPTGTLQRPPEGLVSPTRMLNAALTTGAMRPSFSDPLLPGGEAYLPGRHSSCGRPPRQKELLLETLTKL